MYTKVVITSATTTLICNIVKRPEYYTYQATIGVTGTFGGTAVTYFWSPDQGTTKYPITSAPGTAVTSTAADSFNIQLGTGKNNTDHVTLYATTTGGSGINITIAVEDNN